MFNSCLAIQNCLRIQLELFLRIIIPMYFLKKGIISLKPALQRLEWPLLMLLT